MELMYVEFERKITCPDCKGSYTIVINGTDVYVKRR